VADDVEGYECKWCGDLAVGWYFCSQTCRLEWRDSANRPERLGEPKPLRRHA